jgi:hypothetical protein
MIRRLLFVPFVAVALVACTVADDKKPSADELAKAKKALQEIGDFVGQWNGNGEAKIAGKNTLWKETLNFGWKFGKAGETSVKFEAEGGKYFTAGELSYDAKAKLYRFAVKDAAGTEQQYAGTYAKQRLVLERKDAKNGDVHKLTMNTAAEGVRFLLAYEVQAGGKGLPTAVAKLSANKAGESLAGGGKKNECIVTGGLGTIAVSFEGKTYYVCCSGCRDEFNDNPKKYVDAAAKKK